MHRCPQKGRDLEALGGLRLGPRTRGFRLQFELEPWSCEPRPGDPAQTASFLLTTPGRRAESAADLLCKLGQVPSLL